jgi:hypothetical protein
VVTRAVAAAFSVLALTVPAASTAANSVASKTVVLGSKTSFEPYGRGWGLRHPVSVDNGGDPSGKAWDLRWTHWGKSTTSAAGLTYLGPSKSRDWRKGRLQFRASRLGRCGPSGPRAYTRLQVRVAELHGGAFGAWQLWNGRLNLCHS